MSIKYKYGHYIDLPEQREILRTASCDSERRRFQAAIITNNCLAKLNELRFSNIFVEKRSSSYLQSLDLSRLFSFAVQMYVQ